MKKQVDSYAGSAPIVPGTVYADAVYRVDELKARMGWKEAAFRAACRKGLKVHRVGKRAYVSGVDAIAFVVGKEVAK